ncbi:ABC-type dipeptide/oligopeptide/nickel transport system, permease component [Frankia torreyi]|uniref:ABC-type dipeptide/oligopeptide/nickel transport system, permease component n=1 Tax=Frankia torreyi TaxID=1856 RepID=A0A0D8BG01_9ACTN|nr:MULTISPECIES: ABC transporter permease [Frankia]KJE23081.1 ABC-type dipeptide/oligopeptide/nickel transport system, permease component [Frankia torreyi]KQM06604.1 ABC-type dipeptide/oligopeptide/nickel transport system, permease component [Frankia sp. CpI1-P]
MTENARGPLRRALRLRSTKIALVILAVVAFFGFAGGALAPHDPLAQDTGHILAGPSGAHWLGTDYLGRDVLSRLMDATGRSVVGAVEAVAVAFLLGVPAGLGSVYFGRLFEWVAQRITDAVMTLPYIVFAIAVTGVIGNGQEQAMLAVGVFLAPLFFRVTRAAALTLTRAQYVEIAELLGASRWWIIRHHVWSKVFPTVAVTTAQMSAIVLLSVSSLTFLGIGVKPPAPTWGGMLSSDLGFLAQQPWAPLFPALAIMLSAGMLNAIADAIRDTTGVATIPLGRSRLRRPAVTIPAQEKTIPVQEKTIPAQEKRSHA